MSWSMHLGPQWRSQLPYDQQGDVDNACRLSRYQSTYLSVESPVDIVPSALYQSIADVLEYLNGGLGLTGAYVRHSQNVRIG